MSDFDKSYEELAAQIAKEASTAPNLADKVDALKALTPFYTFARKHAPKKPSGSTMEGLRERIQDADRPRIVGGTDAEPT